MSGDELTRLRAEPDRERDLLAGPSGHSERLPHPPNGFRRCSLVHVRGKRWPDHVTRNSPAEFPASRAKGANLPGINAPANPAPKAQAREEHDMTDTTAYGREQT